MTFHTDKRRARAAEASVAEIKCKGKRAFRSERIAQKRADEGQAKFGVPLYPYRCPLCKDWHLTKLARGAPKYTVPNPDDFFPVP